MSARIGKLTQNHILTILAVVFLLVSVLLGLSLVRERQTINKKAASASGTLTLSLVGPSSVNVGDNLPISLRMSGTLPDAINDGILTIGARLTYPNTQAVNLTSSSIQKSISDPDSWAFNVRRVTSDASTTTVEIGLSYSISGGSNGFIPSNPETVATLNFSTLSAGTLTLSFDASATMILTRTNSDVLELNSSLNSSYPFTIVGTASPTPTLIPSSPTPTPTSSPTNPTSTPTPTPSSSSSADPNNCNGTCGSNSNCKGGLFCYKETGKSSGFCRNPFCSTTATCVCTASPTPTKVVVRTESPTPRTNRTPTPVAYVTGLFPTPTLVLELIPTVTIDTPTPQPGGGVLANATKLLVVGGIWLLVILIIIWLVKKYRDSQSKEKSIEALANRFRTQDPKDQSKPVTPPTPTTQPTPPPPPTPQS